MIIHGLNKLTETPDNEVHMAIGSFDGVHLGHQQLIDSAIEGAQNTNGVSVVLTFWPHPTACLRPEHPTLTLMPPEVKNHFLEERGVDIVIQQAFTKNFSKISAKDFVKLLKTAFPKLKAIHTGQNFRFGHHREGDTEFLKHEGQFLGFQTIQHPPVLYKDTPISSSRIREALQKGQIEEVNKMLGYPYYSQGMVIDKKSSQTEFPTLNIVWRPELKPQYGVYAIKAKSGKKGKEFKGIANYGVAPTIKNDTDPTLQVYLFDPTEWGPGDFLTIQWIHFLRPEIKFESKESLNKQIKQDIETTQSMLF